MIFPNPASDKFIVKGLMFKVKGSTMELLDLNGKKLLEKQIHAGTETVEIDVSGLKSGVYFCRLLLEEKSITKKLIIK